MSLWRRCPAKPYDRPPTAGRNNNLGLLPMVVDTTTRLIYAATHKIFGVLRKRVPPLQEINEEPHNVSQEAGRNVSCFHDPEFK
ncbi:hypothetical protein L1887_38599 [Cichorium endivia]|nr:hypothetical protein L1887_38599 [Cichorium endivia]